MTVRTKSPPVRHTPDQAQRRQGPWPTQLFLHNRRFEGAPASHKEYYREFSHNLVDAALAAPDVAMSCSASFS